MMFLNHQSLDQNSCTEKAHWSLSGLPRPHRSYPLLPLQSTFLFSQAQLLSGVTGAAALSGKRVGERCRQQLPTSSPPCHLRLCSPGQGTTCRGPPTHHVYPGHRKREPLPPHFCSLYAPPRNLLSPLLTLSPDIWPALPGIDRGRAGNLQTGSSGHAPPHA